jgi:hypothetical protein
MDKKAFYSKSAVKKQITIIIPLTHKEAAEAMAAAQNPPVSASSIYALAIKNFLGL